jgi:CheY-like chemotaxis protein
MSVTAAAQGLGTDIGPLFVLAVDDDGLVLSSTTAMLENLGHTVFEATSGRQALDILRREPMMNLVIADQAMPHMTGTELAEAIRAEWPNLPIVLATGYDELPEANAELPMLAKPFRQKELTQAITDAIQPIAQVPRFRAR